MGGADPKVVDSETKTVTHYFRVCLIFYPGPSEPLQRGLYGPCAVLVRATRWAGESSHATTIGRRFIDAEAGPDVRLR